MAENELEAQGMARGAQVGWPYSLKGTRTGGKRMPEEEFLVKHAVDNWRKRAAAARAVGLKATHAAARDSLPPTAAELEQFARLRRSLVEDAAGGPFLPERRSLVEDAVGGYSFAEDAMLRGIRQRSGQRTDRNQLQPQFNQIWGRPQVLSEGYEGSSPLFHMLTK